MPRAEHRGVTRSVVGKAQHDIRKNDRVCLQHIRWMCLKFSRLPV